jgi:hypothetical protein
VTRVEGSAAFGAEITVLRGFRGDCGVDRSSEADGVADRANWGVLSATSTQ